MKILTVNTYDVEGGAAKAAYRLHKALVNAGINSHMLVQSKSSDDFTVLGKLSRTDTISNNLREIIDDLPTKFYKNRSKTHFSPAWVPYGGMAEKINALNPDIVHLHWIGGGMMRIKEIAKIKAPVVWSLHDMWPFTGGCHYDEFCAAYRKSCGNCKVLGSKSDFDISRQIHKRKAKAYEKKADLTIIGLSKWMAKCAAESTLFKDKKVIHLPNLIDSQTFKAVDKCTAREIFNLPSDKKLVMFGAMAATSDSRKGFKELSRALTKLKRDDIELVVYGSGKPQTPPDFKFNTTYIGKLNDETSLKTLYSAADVMVVPSLQENLSNAIMESLSCGTPVVSFDIGGNSDLIDHKQNGYLAKPFDTDELAFGIDWILSSSNYEKISDYARKKVVENFDMTVVVKEYIHLYKKILSLKEPIKSA